MGKQQLQLACQLVLESWPIHHRQYQWLSSDHARCMGPDSSGRYGLHDRIPVHDSLPEAEATGSEFRPRKGSGLAGRATRRAFRPGCASCACYSANLLWAPAFEREADRNVKPSSAREMTFALAVFFIVGWLFVNLMSLSKEYPYYFQWDMDLTSTVDGLMLGSGQMPAHINHTGFGMYLLQTATIGLARQTDAISVSSLEEVSSSLDPLSGVAELTTFLRLHSPFVGVALVLLAWAALSILFQPTRLVSIMALAVLSTMTSLLYHAAIDPDRVLRCPVLVGGASFYRPGGPSGSAAIHLILGIRGRCSLRNLLSLQNPGALLRCSITTFSSPRPSPRVRCGTSAD